MSVSTQEKNSILSLFPYVSEKVVALDVGSNKGLWADIIINERDSSTLAGQYDIHLFEPNDIMLNYTRIKYEYNKNITYVGLAAFSADDKQIPFYYFTNENNGLSSIYYNEKWKDLPMKEGVVNTITLDSYCRGMAEVDFIKIDTEGSECDILDGCKEILKNKKAKFVQVEYSPHYKLNGRKFKDLIVYMENFGYYCHWWDGQYYVKVDAVDFTEDYRLENFVFSYLPITKYHYTQPSWNKEFIKNTEGLGKFDLVLEVGCFEGLTTNYICDNLLNEGGRVICVDPLEDVYLSDDEKANEGLDYFKGQYERFIRNTKGQPVELIRKKSADAYEYLKQYSFDFAYIDGDHRDISVFRDAVNIFPLIKIGGFMLFDDYENWSSGTKRAIDVFVYRYRKYNRLEVVIKDYQVLIKKIAS